MDNMYDADLFPVLDVDIFPMMPEYEWTKPDALKGINEPTPVAPKPMDETRKADEVKIEKNQASSASGQEKTASGEKKTTAPPKKASASRVYISNAEQKKTTGQSRSASSEQNPKMKGTQRKPEQLYWIVVFLMVIFGAWPIALILFFCKNLFLNKMKTEMKKKGL